MIASERLPLTEPVRIVAALTTTELAVGYGKTVVVERVNLDIAPGSVLKIDGPNAAGKSTVVKTLVGVLPPLSGEVSICGYSLAHQGSQAKQRLGYSSGDLAFLTLTGREHLRIATLLWGVSDARVVRFLARIARWPLAAHLDAESRTYSRGTLQQLSLAIALLHEPSILVLDESFDNLDDETLQHLLILLQEQVDLGMTLLYVSHRHEELWPDSGQSVLTIRHNRIEEVK